MVADVTGKKEKEGGISPRNPIIALLLSICPGLGQQYAGHLVKGITFYILLIIASWLAAIAFMYVESRISMFFLAVPFVGVALIALDAYSSARRQPKNYRLKWFNRPIIYAGVFLFLLATINPLMDMLIGGNIVRAYYLTSESMSPTLLKHDLLVINRMASPARGDVVLLDYRSEQTPSRLSEVKAEKLLVRRIVGVPGDKIEVRGKEVFVNDKKLDEPYAHYDENTSLVTIDVDEDAFGPEQVPPNSWFVLGDNRNFSLDSRVIGYISSNKISGKVVKVFWSWNFDKGGIEWSRTAMAVK